MSLFLAGLLVRGGVLTPEAVEEALQRQTRQGGSLDTNLLELGAVDEETLAIYLSRASGLPVAPKGSLEAPAAALRTLLPLRLAERHAVVPFAQEDREVHLACVHPMEATYLDEMALLLSQRIVAYVAPEFRIRRAIALLYGEPVPPRFQDLLDRMLVGRGRELSEEAVSVLRGEGPGVASDPPAVRAPAAAPASVAESVGPKLAGSTPGPAAGVGGLSSARAKEQIFSPATAFDAGPRMAPPTPGAAAGGRQPPQSSGPGPAPSPPRESSAGPRVTPATPGPAAAMRGRADARAPAPSSPSGTSAGAGTAAATPASAAGVRGPSDVHAPGATRLPSAGPSAAPSTAGPAAGVSVPTEVRVSPVKETSAGPGARSPTPRTTAGGILSSSPSSAPAAAKRTPGAETGAGAELPVDGSGTPRDGRVGSTAAAATSTSAAAASAPSTRGASLLTSAQPTEAIVGTSRPPPATAAAGRAEGEPDAGPVRRRSGEDGSASDPKSASAKPAAPAPKTRSTLKLSMEEALAWLASTTDRDEALEVLLRFASSHFSFAATLQVQGRSLLGRDALGPEPDLAALVKKLTFSLDEPSVLQKVVETGARHLGPLGAQDPAHRLSTDLARKPPHTVLVQPIPIAGRSVALLYAENGVEALPPSRADLVTQVALAVGRKLEQLIHARKSSRQGQGAGSGDLPAPGAAAPVPPRAHAAPGGTRANGASAAQPSAAVTSSAPPPSSGVQAEERRVAPITNGTASVRQASPSERGAGVLPAADGAAARASLEIRPPAGARPYTSAGPDQLPIGSKGVERLLASRTDEELRDAVSSLLPLGNLTASLLISLLPGEGNRGGRGLSGVPRVVSALEMLGEAALPALRQAAASPSPLVRYEVARLIRRCSKDAPDPTLIVLSGDEDPKVAAAAQGQG